jgi:serine protease inhibitor
MDMTPVDFATPEEAASAVNAWAEERREFAANSVTNGEKGKKNEAISGDSDAAITRDEAIVASSIYLDVVWKKSLFKKSESNITFFVVNKKSEVS